MEESKITQEELDEIQDDNWEQEKIADRTLEKLKLELSIREDNLHIGSGLGGNPSEFFFALTHSFKAVCKKDLKEARFEKIGANEMVLFFPSNPDMKQIRAEFTKLFNNHVDRMTVSSDQLTDRQFLEGHSSKSLEIKLLATVVEQCEILLNWLKPKVELHNKIFEVFEREYISIKNNFLREMKLPLSSFDKDETGELDLMLGAHPVWGTKRKGVSDRFSRIETDLLSQDDLDRLATIGSFPSYITMFAFRKIISLDRLVALNLDLRCKFLDEISKKLNY